MDGVPRIMRMSTQHYSRTLYRRLRRSSMNDQTRRRRAIAQRIGPVYATNPFEQRLRRILRDAPRPAVDETHRLIEEVFALVERYLPEFDTAPARAEFNDKRNGERGR